MAASDTRLSVPTATRSKPPLSSRARRPTHAHTHGRRVSCAACQSRGLYGWHDAACEMCRRCPFSRCTDVDVVVQPALFMLRQHGDGQTHTHKLTDIQTHTDRHTHRHSTHSHTHTRRTHIHMHARTHSQTHTDRRTHIDTRRTHIHTHALTHRHTHTDRQTDTRRHSTNSHTHERPHTQTQTDRHT